MKKLFLFGILALVIVGFGTCGGNDKELSKEKAIVKFVVNGVEYNISVNAISHFYTKRAVGNWDGLPTGLIAPEITLSDKAKIDPPASELQDFNKNGEIVRYTVTAEDGSSRQFIVSVTLGGL